MSGGVGESGSRNSSRDEEELKRNSGGADKFGHAIARIAVAQICESSGFQSFQKSALDALADIGIRFLCDLGKTAHSYANSAGRTECNVFDVIQGLEDLNSCWGFPGASDVNRCLAGSGAVSEIAKFVESEEEIPFARPVPQFPIIRSRRPPPSFAQIGEASPGKHIPDWLPAFPDPHTYIQTRVWYEQAKETYTNKIEQSRKRKKAERSLLSLKQRLACNDAVGSSLIDAIDDAVKAKGASESNPFLAPPLQFGEKQVSSVAIPGQLLSQPAAEKRVSVVETFGPAMEAMQNGRCKLEDNKKKVLPNKRPTVYFRLGIDKRSVDLTARNSGAEKMASWFLKEDEKDGKKRRVEQILKESIENSQDIPQL